MSNYIVNENAKYVCFETKTAINSIKDVNDIITIEINNVYFE